MNKNQSNIFNNTHLKLTAIGAFGDHGQHVVKLVVLPKRPVLEYAIILRKLMVEYLVMVLTKRTIPVK